MLLNVNINPYEKMMLPIIGPIQCVCACAVQPKMRRPMGKMIMPICATACIVRIVCYLAKARGIVGTRKGGGKRRTCVMTRRYSGTPWFLYFRERY